MIVVVTIYGSIALGCVAWLSWRGGYGLILSRVVGSNPILDVAFGVAVGLVIVAATRLLTPQLAPLRRMELALAQTIGPMSRPTALVVAAFSAWGEELLFRAVIQPVAGLMVASVLFAVVHVPFERALWLWPVFAFGMGLLLGGLFDWTGAVLAPMTVHLVVNYLNLRQIARRARAELRS